MARKLQNWLKAVGELTQQQEAPEHFWLWSGLFTLGAAMGRKVRLPFGMSPILPNLYVILVAKPGFARKGGPIAFSKKLLQKVNVSIGVDSTSRSSFLNELAQQALPVPMPNGKFETHSELALISKELSSFFSLGIKDMTETLTDIYDFHEPDWTYKTRGGGTDKIYNPCVSFFAATTPTWLAMNLPMETIGAGFVPRVIFVVAMKKKGRITFPVFDYGSLYQDLLHDLGEVCQLKGEFQWEEEAMVNFDSWYLRIDEKYQQIEDERFHDTIERLHVQVLKVAMCIRVAYSNDLILTARDIAIAIDIVENHLHFLPEAFGPMGRNKMAIDIDRILSQIRKNQEISEGDLLRANWKNVNQSELGTIINSLISMGQIVLVRTEICNGVINRIVKWKN